MTPKTFSFAWGEIAVFDPPIGYDVGNRTTSTSFVTRIESQLGPMLLAIVVDAINKTPSFSHAARAVIRTMSETITNKESKSVFDLLSAALKMANLVVIQANHLLEEPEFVSVTSTIIYRGRAFFARAGNGFIEWIPQDNQIIPLTSCVPPCSPLGRSEDFEPEICFQVPGKKNNYGFNEFESCGIPLEPGEAISLSTQDNENPDLLLKILSLRGKKTINKQKNDSAIDKEIIFLKLNKQDSSNINNLSKKTIDLKVFGKFFLLFLIGFIYLSIGSLSFKFLFFSRLEPTGITRDEGAEFSQPPTTELPSTKFSPTPRVSEFFIKIIEIESSYAVTYELPNGDISQLNNNSNIAEGSTINTSQGRLAFEILSKDMQKVADVILLPDSSLAFQGDGIQMIELKEGVVWINAPDNSLIIKTVDSPTAELIVTDGQIAIDMRNTEQKVVICFSGTCLFRPYQEVNFIAIPKGELYVLNKSFDLVLGKNKITEDMLVRMNELCGMCLSNVASIEFEYTATLSHTNLQKSTPSPSIVNTQTENSSTPIHLQPTNATPPSRTPTFTGTPTLALTQTKTPQSTFTFTATSTNFVTPGSIITDTPPTPTINSSAIESTELIMDQINSVYFAINSVTMRKLIFQR